jgi:hypothetical protein
MQPRTVALLTVVSAAPFGLAFLLAPELVSSLFGVSGYNTGTVISARKYGVGLLLASAGAFAIAGSNEAAVIRRFSAGFAAANALGAVVSTHAASTNAANVLMWAIAALFALLAALWFQVFRSQ